MLATGYFLVAREGFRLLSAQGRGGNLIFVASKNALVAGKNAAAYSTAKAAEAHLARCLAEEGGQFGIRVNTVNPDAVLAGSRIWDSAWRQERAAQEHWQHPQRRWGRRCGVSALRKGVDPWKHAIWRRSIWVPRAGV